MARSVGEDGPHPVDRHVGRRVLERRLSLGYSQSDLSRALGLTFQQVQKYEKGLNRISASKLWDTARFLNVDVSDFFEGLDTSDAPTAPDEEGPVFAATRHSIEIARTVGQLSVRQQRLALALMLDMADRPEQEPE